MNDLSDNLARIHKTIDDTCKKVGRNPLDVKLLMATKTMPADIILQALNAGEVLIGENRVQELIEKYDALSTVPHTTHLIGQLQTNKINKIIGKVACVESVDSFKLAEAMNTRLSAKNEAMDILVEVNTSGEKSKSGCTPAECIDLVGRISELPAVHVKGLMTIGALTDDAAIVRRCFQTLKKLFDTISANKIPGVTMRILSMGMSSDFQTAIEEGSTEVRIGTALFGRRVYK